MGAGAAAQRERAWDMKDLLSTATTQWHDDLIDPIGRSTFL
jgi:hypothetical protein